MLLVAAAIGLTAPAHAEPRGGDPTVTKLLNSARTASDRGDRDQALRDLAMIERVDPEHRAASLLQIYLLTDSRAFDKAQQRARTLTERLPQDAGAWLAAAYAWRHGGDPSRALGAYQRVAELEPRNVDAWIGQVLMLQASGAPELALDAVAHAPVTIPADVVDTVRADAAAHLMRAARRLAEGSDERTVRLEQAASALDAMGNQNDRVKADRLVLHALRGDHAEVVSRYAAWFDPKSAPSWATRTAAFSHYLLGDARQALALFDAVLAIDAKDEVAARGRRLALAEFEPAMAAEPLR